MLTVSRSYYTCFISPEVLAGDVSAEVPGDALGADKGEDLCVIVI